VTGAPTSVRTIEASQQLFPPRSISVDVRGLPRPQGSMRLHTLANGHTAARYPAAVWAWRHQVQQAVAELGAEQFTGAIELRLGFDLPRPAAHYGTGRNLARLKPSARPWPISAPDLDKLVRCISDAVTDAGLWHDDSQVVSIKAAKRYAAPPGVLITIKEVT
jgi:Holliday junction resolvase RusA-like endonuclease